MRVGIYNEPAGGGIGGSEISVAVLAEALKDRHQVDIIHHKPCLDLKRLAAVSETDLSAVRMRYLAVEPYSNCGSLAPWRRYREARDWRAALSEPYDLFINFTHGYPPFCHAPRGVLVVLFPLHESPRPAIREEGPPGSAQFAEQRLKSLYHDWEWQKRLSTYQIKTTISQFSQIWTKRRWGFDSEIIHPPVDMRFQPGVKTHTILSVGRFTATGHSKKQLEMVAAFDALQTRTPGNWDYFTVGGLSDDDVDQQYYQCVSGRARECRVQALPNIDRHCLKELYARARIFWHAAGYGESEERPELSEHFGIATVEAMSAGCVPLAIDKGGQREIVQHGESGFLWDRLEELKEYTELLMRDERLRVHMAEAARIRATLFSREQFVNRFLSLMG